MSKLSNYKPSLENLIEHEELGLEIFHPGGLSITKALAELCHVSKNKTVLDVASGSGESAIYLAKQFSCQVTGLDHSDLLIEKSNKKVHGQNLPVHFQKGDVHQLSFPDNSFDAVISECTLCVLEKERALKEMVRVCKVNGYVGIHDLVWQNKVPATIKRQLKELEDESPETCEGWKNLFKKAGLVDVQFINKSEVIENFVGELRRKIGWLQQLTIFYKILRAWKLSGLIKLLHSEKLFNSKYIGYGIIVGRKP